MYSFRKSTPEQSGNLHEDVGELKTCPFCNCPAELIQHEGKIASGHYSAEVSCTSCDNVSTNYEYDLDKAEASRRAIEAWNLRDGVFP